MLRICAPAGRAGQNEAITANYWNGSRLIICNHFFRLDKLRYTFQRLVALSFLFL